MYQYTNDGRVTVGDRVLYGRIPGRIVFIVEESAYHPPYKEEDWAYLKEGLGVLWDDDTLFVLHDNYDDLLSISDGQ